MDGITLSMKGRRMSVDLDYERSYELELREEWRLATGLVNHRSFELDDWIPQSYFDEELN
jgi:hypothetical protein